MGLVGWNGESEWVRATLSGAVEVDTSELELKKLEASWTRTVFRVKFCGAEERTDEGGQGFLVLFWNRAKSNESNETQILRGRF